MAIARRLGHRGWTAATLRALGISREALGDLDGAAAAFEESLRTSEHLLMFTSWAHSRLALVLLAQERHDAAAAHVQDALATGPGLAQYEARLACCELAVKRGEANASALVDEALRLAVAGGHAVSAARLSRMHDEISIGRDVS